MNAPRGGLRRRGFTLVEVLVVITIIGILIALMLPAVQAAREAGRRLQCENHLKQIGTAIQAHVEVQGVFPSGGDTPWPLIEDYRSSGHPNGPDKQGLGWAFQILPYLEQDAAYNLPTQAELNKVGLSIWFCPSRRRITRHASYGTVLNDYAAATPGAVSDQEKDRCPGDSTEIAATFWGGDGTGTYRWVVQPGLHWRGVIVRSAWDIHSEEAKQNGPRLVEGTSPVAPARIFDGTSNTLVISEKRLHPARYESGDSHDDRGWSDGWDYDVIRSTGLAPQQDSLQSGDITYQFGSAHVGGVNALMADGSVRRIGYTIEPEVFNLLGDRRDRKPIDFGRVP